MLPDGWKLTTLGEVCNGQLQTGPFGSQLHADEYTDEGVAVIMPKDLSDGRANKSTAAKIPKERALSLIKHRLESGDLLFSRRGDVTRNALITENEAGSICGTGCLRARPSTNHCPDFVAYFIQKEPVKKWLEKSAVGQTMPNMNTSILSELPLAVASSKQEEKKIAQILSTWDKAIATTEKLIANSKAQKKALMQQLLTGKRRKKEYGDSGASYMTRYGALPQDWGFVPIGEIAHEVSERNINGSAYPVLSCSKYDGFVNSLEYFKKKVYSDDLSNYKLVRRGDFGFPSNHIEEGSIGYQSICLCGVVSPIYTVFRTAEDVIDGYLYKLLKTEHYRQIFAAATNASVDRRGSLRWNEFKKIRVPLPSIEEQAFISNAIDSVDQKLVNYNSQLETLSVQKRALMQQLLTGKRRVKVKAA